METKKGGDKVDVLIRLAIELVNSNSRSSIDFANKAYELAYQIGDSVRIVHSGRINGEILRRNEKINEAITILTQILPIAKRNSFKNETKYILNSLALSYTVQANYDKGLSYNFQSLVLREEDGNKAEISISLNNIGFLYFKLRNYEMASEYYMKALKLKKEINDTYELDRLLINIGLSYNQLGNYIKARDYILQGFKTCEGNCFPAIRIEGQFGLGVSYFKETDYEKSLLHFNQSYDIAKKEGNIRFQLENLVYLAKIALHYSDNEKASNFLKEAESIAFETEYNLLLIEIYKLYSDLYNTTRDFENAAQYQSKYIHLKDSIYNESLIKNIAKIQTDYEERENIAIIATKEEVIQRQRSLNIAIGVIAVLACLLIFVLYQSNKVKKRVNQALSDAKNFIELKNIELDKKVAEKTADLVVANDSLSKVNEELDNFIYKTSHDIRGPLASLKGICNVALMDVKDPVAVSYLEKLDITAENLNTILTRLLIINQINNSSVKPEPINFDFIIEEVMLLEKKRGLPPRLQVKKYIQEGVEFYCDKEFIRIILENLIDNAIKFYNDSDRVEPFVEVRIEEENREMKIRVIDNGIGISEAKPDKIFQMFSRASERSSTGGIGLYITKTACEKIGGQVGLRTTPEGYTEFYVKFVMDSIIAPAEFDA
ncbi:MAG TPA: tetratricopeptide repeat protein [Cyclobacteriaceae bacterium]|nr:tetratricopeptide repeat protein [Cyclobacteriaceae bacterium]